MPTKAAWLKRGWLCTDNAETMKRFARRLILALLAGVALPAAYGSPAPWPEALAGQVEA